MSGWTVSQIAPQSGRSFLITGASGLGYHAALEVGRAGGQVILAGRNAERGAEAVSAIRAEVPAADIRFEPLDLADLASIRSLGARMRSGYDSLDVLINNAGVMNLSTRRVTADGFELMFGTNHLGHFVLTDALLPLLRKGTDPRVVTVSSLAARSGAIDFDDLQSQGRYSPMAAYGASKLANLLFAFELQRRSDAAGWGLTSIAAHPGASRTNLIANGAGGSSVIMFLERLMGPIMFQPAAKGALPLLFSAVSPGAKAGVYYGPGGFFEMRGAPALARVTPRARDIDVGIWLWKASEDLTG